MWGVLFQIGGERMRASVPGFLASAGGSHACIDYLGECVRELNRDPVRHGFDPRSAYTVLAQTWDLAFSGARSVAWGRERVGQPAVGLIPDFYYTLSRGFADLRAAAALSPPWRERDPAVVWRGAITGRGPYERPDEAPRVRLLQLGKGVAGLDLAATHVHDTTRDDLPGGRISDLLAAEGLGGDRWPMPRFGRYRHTVDIDGHANAWGFLEKLILGCCVLKVDSPYEQWFYPRLRRGEHYVPVRADLSDLHEQVAWCRDNEAECEWIAANGARLAASMTYERELERSCEAVLAAARAAPGV